MNINKKLAKCDVCGNDVFINQNWQLLYQFYIVLERFIPIVQDLTIGLYWELILIAIALVFDSKFFLSRNLSKILKNKSSWKCLFY